MSRYLELAKRDSSGKEQYYTVPDVALKCFNLAEPYMKDLEILEPSAGTGEFLKVLGNREFTALDIEPKHPQVLEQDFLEFKTDKTFFTIGNPPFGRNHSMSVKFFNHAANFSNYIAFIIPKSWRKWSVQNRLDQRFHLVEDIELPKDIFYNHDGEGFGSNFNAIFQIWEKRETLRDKVIVTPRDDIVKCNPTEANIALTYAGYSAGKVELDFERKPNTTKIYLKVSDKVRDELLKMDYSKFTQNSAFTPVFGLAEVIQELNKVIK